MDKKKKSINIIIPLGVYPFDLMVSIGESDIELKKTLNKFDIEWSENMKIVGSGLFYMTEKNQSFIRLRNFPNTPVDFGYLHHEIFHATTFILDRCGMKLALLKSDEAYAYLCQFITEKIYDKIM